MLDFEKSYELPMPLARVYEAWVSEATVIPPASRMRVEPKPGGVYRLEMQEDLAMEGRFLEVEPGARLVYTWQWTGDDESTEVAVNFRAVGDATQVTISHTGFVTEVSLANHAQGWDSYIEGLIAHLEGGV